MKSQAPTLATRNKEHGVKIVMHRNQACEVLMQLVQQLVQLVVGDGCDLE